MSKQKREYTIYAIAPGMGFTSKSVAHSQGSHRWTYTVYATSIKQAYFLAGKKQFAASATDVGVRRLEYDWWHYDCDGPEDAEAKDWLFIAPYLKKQK